MINQLILNDILEETGTGTRYRVLYMDKCNDDCILIELNTTKLNIQSFSLSGTIERLKKNELNIIIEESAMILKSDEAMTQTEKDVLNKRWEIMETILELANEPEIYIKRYRAIAMEQAMKKHSAVKSSVYRFLRLYLQGGKNRFALMSTLSNCGAKNQTKNYSTKTGRPNPQAKKKELGASYCEGIEGVILDERHLNNINTSIERYVFGNKGIGVTKAWDLMKRDYYTYEDNFGQKITLPYYQIPTLRQFQHCVVKLKEGNFGKYYRNVVGEKKFNLTARALLSNTVYDVPYPGFRFEIDATKPHIYLLDKARKNAIGTPIVYYVVDTFTKMIVGLSVGLDNASWNGASSALYNCIEDKVAYAKRYGMDISASDWLNSSLPQNILADKGEFASKLPIDLIQTLGISIENTPSGRGDMKGNVEKLFHLTEAELFGLIPGFSKQNYKVRGEIDINKKARFTLGDVTQAYILSVIKHNKSMMEKYPITQDMLADKLSPIPNEIWKWGLENLGSALIRYDEKLVRYVLMREGKASITERGICFQGINYSTDIALAEGWFTKARVNGRTKLKVKFDERNLNKIFMMNSNSTQIIELYQTDASKMSYSDLTVCELAVIKGFKKTIKLEGLDTQNEVDGEFFDSIRDLSAKANKFYKAENGKENPTTGERRVNRKIENESERKGQALSNMPGTSFSPVASSQKKSSYKDMKNQMLLDEIKSAN